MEFKSKISQIDFQQKRTSLHILKDYRFSKEITILKQDDVFNASCNKVPYLHVCQLNQDDEEFVSDVNVSSELLPN